MRSSSRKLWMAVACVVGAALVAGCSSSQDVPSGAVSGDAAASGGTSFSGEVPEFSGPWAEDFATDYKRTESDLARRILATGKIAESDLAEVQQADKECLEALGYTDVQHFPQGGMSLTPPVDINDQDNQELVKGCSDQTGLTQIESLYASMLVNPNNENMDELAVKCLIEEKIVEPSFTVADLQSWYDNEDPRLLSTGEAGNCTYDPLRLTGEW